ncbi:site-specific integrase [Nitrospirillum amazonense]|uniref:site-specific integrase n=1 Tax=Nitrospirillum amazonense TaxID=28077 RepID=UPI002DD42FB1|nr:site-specific integrase [Nitrospirillum amazonense]MEC4591659.1 site-specific integrase [Nitrospirillum amazonense]
MTLNAAAIRWWDEAGQHGSHARDQAGHVKGMIAYFGGQTRLSDINDAAWARFMAWLMQPKEVPGQERPDGTMGKARVRKGAGPATANRYLSTFNVIRERAEGIWGVKVGAFTRSKHVKAEPDHLEVFLSYEESEELLAAIVPHARLPILLDLLTGLRKQNILGLRWEDVSLDMKRMVVLQKGDRRMIVDLVDEAVALLNGLEPNPNKRRGPVFWFGNPAVPCDCSRCNDTGGPGGTNRYSDEPMKDIKRAFNTARVKIGKPNLRFHDLRHTVASWILNAGFSLAHVKETLGHSEIATTMRYAHLEAGQKKTAMTEALSVRRRKAKGAP